MGYTLFSGSINLSKLMKAAKEQHSSMARGEKSGQVFANVTVFLNDEPDQYGNVLSMCLNSKEEAREGEGKIYFGNAKPGKKKEAPPVEAAPGEFEENDLPF